MGSSMVHSAYGPTFAPGGGSLSPGGSSGGSAAAVAAEMCHGEQRIIAFFTIYWMWSLDSLI